jgi:hypothetical protein
MLLLGCKVIDPHLQHRTDCNDSNVPEPMDILAFPMLAKEGL